MLRLTAAALAALAIAVALCAVAATAEEPGDSTGVQAALEKTATREDLLKTRNLVQSEQERRTFRLAYWAAGLTGDKKVVYDTYGNPSYRWREEQLGTVTETWMYLGSGRRFTFLGDRLIED
jgi:hypothetical protein